MAAVANPFRPTRWEHESSGSPLIWFTPTAGHLAADKSVFVYGSRGSGKTTLLKSICWEDLFSNPSLRIQKTISDFNHIGVYIRLPDHVSGSMGYMRWSEIFPDSPRPDYEFFRFYSLAVELIAIEKALSAAHTLRVEGVLTLSAGAELSIVASTTAEFPEILSFTEQPPKTFVDLSRALRSMVRRMNEACGRGYVKNLVDKLPTCEPNELLSFVIERLSNSIAHSKLTSGQRLGFKFCLDDCEVMSPLQRKSVNTLVRKSRFPISWVICSVGEAVEAGETFIDEQPLTDADRRVVSLDDRDRPEFQALCEAVASLRVYFSLRRDRRPSVTGSEVERYFSLKARLGTAVVNDIIDTIVSRSTSPLARQLREAAEFLVGLDLAQYGLDRTPAGALPYYQAYVLWHWTGQKENFSPISRPEDFGRIAKNAKAMKAKSQQAWMRRKSVGAMLHIANRLGFRRLPMSGVSVITSLADGSIRDFLEIMAEIFDRFSKDRSTLSAEEILEKFARSRTKIAAQTQTDGIYASSEAFFDGIGILTDSNAEAVMRFITVLGRLTHHLQANFEDPSSLATAERGLFFIDPARSYLANATQIELINQIIHRAELSGYLRATTSKRSANSGEDDGASKISGFRLHRRFAPRFMFSYRGAYEPVKLTEDILYQICIGSPEVDADDWAKQFARRPNSSSQLTLPLLHEVPSFDD
ncbi:hypothetical protein FJW08_21235 [Mesorhizobium sp. B3-2-1]|uniref:ORC-CDC6 family AAA ATPase n=1 Tax=Mesorhizobium sp. B3-2-1 TaxID=2589891 RepID=UPI00112E524B|nr:hypothetical protein [Mesorhizobium sp. B3-2-1]TPI28301.1 hypothetical protein FJW08_21235 [Mesorhizobium sp. B3-2-1]